jgi:hypothetical protein
MNHADALRHIRTLVKVASETDNLDLIREHHRDRVAHCKGSQGTTEDARSGRRQRQAQAHSE